MTIDINPTSGDSANKQRPRILVTGATGYVGGRLWRRLEALGYPVRCMARHPERLEKRVGTDTQVVRGDVLEPETLKPALEGVETAYYLIHSIGQGDSFEEQEKRSAKNFSEAAKQAGVKRVIYLGGLAREGDSLSPHLRSRHEVGRILRTSGVPTIELRAAIVIGSGSLSFEMIRALVERLPFMVTPKWVSVKTQPIAIDDLLQYLIESLDLTPESRVFEIGCADRVSYGGLMREYARQRGLHRIMIPVPVLSLRLSSLWLGLITPLYARVGKKLIESMSQPTVCDNSVDHVFKVEPKGVKAAIALALRNEEREFAETSWFDAISSAGLTEGHFHAPFHNRLFDSRSAHVDVPPADAFAPIRRIGGDTGWYSPRILWKVRGWVDLLVGGVGIRRGRRNPDTLDVGDGVDFWRVERYQPDRHLLLRAEMKLPGRAWIEFKVDPEGEGSVIHQTAVYDPRGTLGLLYWYSLVPIHGPLFGTMLRGIAEHAQQTNHRKEV